MNEGQKIQEALYFYAQILSNYEDRQNLVFNLSAFLSASRSAMQYALEEAKTKRGGQKWYDTYMKTDSLLSFFKDKRDINIHTVPVGVMQETDVKAGIEVGIAVGARVVHMRGGKVLYDSDSEKTAENKIKDTIAEKAKLVDMKTRYRFSDYEGKEDLLELSKLYLEHLNKFVEDGKKQSFVSG